MVWFQCEDCGENLKKPRLPNHFITCSAQELSCIDCGEVFTKKSAQHHTQCITESEKYGPKSQGHASNDTTKSKGANKNHKVDFDINVGLSEHAPWFCSFCNTTVTSKKTLLLHAEGRKHIGKARAFHTSKQPSEAATGGSSLDKSAVNGNSRSGDPTNNTNGDAQKPEEEDEVHPSTKRRKTSNCGQGCDGGDKLADSTVDKLGAAEPKEPNHENVVPIESGMGKKTTSKPYFIVQEPANGLKLKKLITSYLKSTSDGVMKMNKLKRLILNELQGDSVAHNEEKIFEMLEKKIKSSSRLTLVGKEVHLVSGNRLPKPR